jgi:hypothetical protein
MEGAAMETTAMQNAEQPTQPTRHQPLPGTPAKALADILYGMGNSDQCRASLDTTMKLYYFLKAFDFKLQQMSELRMFEKHAYVDELIAIGDPAEGGSDTDIGYKSAVEVLHHFQCGEVEKAEAAAHTPEEARGLLDEIFEAFDHMYNLVERNIDEECDKDAATRRKVIKAFAAAEEEVKYPEEILRRTYIPSGVSLLKPREPRLERYTLRTPLVRKTVSELEGTPRVKIEDEDGDEVEPLGHEPPSSTPRTILQPRSQRDRAQASPTPVATIPVPARSFATPRTMNPVTTPSNTNTQQPLVDLLSSARESWRKRQFYRLAEDICIIHQFPLAPRRTIAMAEDHHLAVTGTARGGPSLKQRYQKLVGEGKTLYSLLRERALGGY